MFIPVGAVTWISTSWSTQPATYITCWQLASVMESCHVWLFNIYYRYISQSGYYNQRTASFARLGVFFVTMCQWFFFSKNVSLSNNLNLNNHSFEFTPIKASAGGTLLYISNHLLYKCCNDLNIYKKNYWNYWNCQNKKIKYYCGSHLKTFIYGPYWL